MLDFILKAIGKIPSFRSNQIAHDGFDAANRICIFPRHMHTTKVDQMTMYSYSRRQQKPGGKGIAPTYSKMRDFDDIFADELRKQRTEEKEDNKDVQSYRREI